MSNYFENIYAWYLWLRNGKSVNEGKTFAVLLTDLSKAFDCLSHDLITAKLDTYRFSLSTAMLMQSYLSSRKQRTKMNTAYSSCKEILLGVPQGSILGPLMFNIFICDLFSIMNKVDFASYADDNTICYRKWYKRGHELFNKKYQTNNFTGL